MSGVIHESEYGDGENNFHVIKHGDVLDVTLTYPPYTDADNAHDQCRHIEVNQESVRASDGIRMHYDYDRDGWVIEQPRVRDPNPDIEEWTEVAFIQSWALDETIEDG